MRAAPSPQRTKPIILPAPVGGINALTNLMSMGPEDCVAAYNFIPETSGMRVRKGYEEVGVGFTGASNGVRTLIPYEGSDPTQDKLFAVTMEGIYDVTTPSGSGYTISAAPHTGNSDFEWGTQTGDAGYCSYVSYTTIAGRFLFVADEVNGLVMYTGSTNTWAVPSITGFTEADIVFVTVWKQRIWFVLRDSGVAYFLDVGLIAGTATEIEFGNKFLNGGFLVSLHNFTMDGGNGPDDYLAAIASSGDVVIYQGTDPAAIATFNMVGVWNLGALPKGRNLASSSGGDLYILCAGGIASLTQILKGTDPGALPAYITGKVTPLVREDIAADMSSRGWGIYSHPSEGLLILTVPDGGDVYGAYGQYVMSTATRSWTRFLGVPMHCAAVWRGQLYFGAPSADDGTVFLYGGYQDNVPFGTSVGDPISAFLLTAFTGQGPNVRVHFAKPQFLARGLPLYEVEARYDFDVNDYLASLSGIIPAAEGTDWGDTWGTVLWEGNELIPYAELKGSAGIGKFAGLALTTRSRYATTLIGFTAMADQGGLL